MGARLKALALLAECSPRIGSGHVVETLHLGAKLGRLPWRAYLSRATPGPLVERFGSRARLVDGFEPEKLARLSRSLADEGFAAAVLNFLKISSRQVSAVRAAGLKAACLTASSAAELGCDLWIDLDIGRPERPGRLGGPRYMALAPAFARLAARPRRHHGPVRDLLIVMGGTDSSGSTLALARALAGRLPGVRKHVVAGPNFAHKAALAKLERSWDASFTVHRDPPDLPSLMARCDAAFTLGSDTSLELACLGTPTILLEEAPHERRQALRLAREGCGLFLGAVADVTPARVERLLRRLDDPRLRRRMARAGKRLVDGKGGERLAREIRRRLLA